MFFALQIVVSRLISVHKCLN